MIAETESDIGSTWLIPATRPRVASIAVSPSRSGMPAATSAPKATRRMISVKGTEKSPARFRSSPNEASSALPVLSPKEPTKTLGCAFCTSATRATTGSILSAASSAGPRISIRTSAECLSPEMKPLFPASYGDSTFATAWSFETPVMTSWTAALNAGSLVVSERLWISTSSPPGCLKSSYRIVSARPDSPGPAVWKTIVFIGEAMLVVNRTIAKASQPKIAFFRCCALQRAIRAARFVGRLCRAGAPGRSPAACSSGSFWITRVFIAAPIAEGIPHSRVAGSESEAGKLVCRGPVFSRLRDPGASGAQVEQYGKDAARLCPGRGKIQFAEDRRHMPFDRTKGDHQPVGDALVRPALGHQAEDFALARRQLSDRIVASTLPEQRRDDDGVARRTAGGDPFPCGEEVLDVVDPVLEQITHTLGRVSEQPHREPKLDVLREDEDADRRMVGTNLQSSPQAFVAMRGRQADVHDRNVRRVTADEQEQPLGRLARADDIEPTRS